MSKATVETEIEKLRQVVTLASTSSEVMPQAEECVKRLNAMFEKDRDQFSREDIRFVNSMRGILAQRQAKHMEKSGPYSAKGKRKGDEFTHCWRCEAPITSQFTEICEECSDPKGYKFRVCPACKACGCQRGQRKLV